MCVCVQVGRVLRIVSSGSSGTSLRLRVNWLYRPEEAEGGRKVRQGGRQAGAVVGSRAVAAATAMAAAGQLALQARRGRGRTEGAQADAMLQERSAVHHMTALCAAASCVQGNMHVVWRGQEQQACA